MDFPQEGQKVKVHYTGTLNDGTTFDSSRERQPLEFQIGAGQIIPGFEKAVKTLEVGGTAEINIPSDEAYGERRDELVMDLEKSKIPAEILENTAVGSQLELKQDNGQNIPVVVTKVEEESITIDANHPLAGKELNFEIELLEINN